MGKQIILIIVLCLQTIPGNSAESILGDNPLKKQALFTKIILIEPDIELLSVLASGQTETRADWSEAGMKNAKHWVKEYFSNNQIDFATYTIPDGQAYQQQRQIRALHEAVGISILNNKTLNLPTKQTFDWSLGAGAQSLSIQGADYGLFMFLRRGYGTGGRVALSVASAVLFGALPVISYQFAFASLVDLQTGEIVWFNNLAQTVGDLRDQSKAENTIRALLTEFPQLDLPEREVSSGHECTVC